LLFDLADQANSAIGHAQGASIAGTQVQTNIVAFETDLATARSSRSASARARLPERERRAWEDRTLRDTVAPVLHRRDDPLKPGFTNAVFSIFAAWEPTAPGSGLLPGRERSGVARRSSTTPPSSSTTSGLNSVPGNPLYNPADPLAGQDIVGDAGSAHSERRQPFDGAADQHRCHDGSPDEQRRESEQRPRHRSTCPSTRCAMPRPAHRSR
jgi:hypothetical protein